MARRTLLVVAWQLLTVVAMGCASAPAPRHEATSSQNPTSYQLARARADGQAWLQEDAERQQQLKAAEQRRREEDARRAAEAAEQARLVEEERHRVAAELAANPYQFEGSFQGGDDECGSAMLFRFADIRGIVRECTECDCKFRTDRTKDGTVWTATCKAAQAKSIRTRLFVSSEFSQEADDGTQLWRATFERTAAGKTTCGYVGSMRDRVGKWKAQEADQTTRRTAPAYTVGTGAETPALVDP